MSDSPSTPDAAPPSNEKSPLMRQIILVVCLGLMIRALYYDRKVARPNSTAKAYKLLQVARNRLYDYNAAAQLSPAEVAEILGKQAARTEETDYYVKETYSWTAGMPFRSYYVVAVYSKARGEPRYTFSMYNEQPTEDMLPGYEPPPSEFDPPPTPSDLQGGGPGPDPSLGSPDPTQGSPDPTQGSPDPTQGSPDPAGSPEPAPGSPESTPSGETGEAGEAIPPR